MPPTFLTNARNFAQHHPAVRGAGQHKCYQNWKIGRLEARPTTPTIPYDDRSIIHRVGLQRETATAGRDNLHVRAFFSPLAQVMALEGLVGLATSLAHLSAHANANGVETGARREVNVGNWLHQSDVGAHRVGSCVNAGREMTNIEPTPGSLVQVMSPPCAKKIERAIDRPRPEPPMSRERALSTR